jgi:hypothetical protein
MRRELFGCAMVAARTLATCHGASGSFLQPAGLALAAQRLYRWHSSRAMMTQPLAAHLATHNGRSVKLGFRRSHCHGIKRVYLASVHGW